MMVFGGSCSVQRCWRPLGAPNVGPQRLHLDVEMRGLHAAKENCTSEVGQSQEMRGRLGLGFPAINLKSGPSKWIVFSDFSD